MNEKIEIKNLTPVIATISAGKTSFLNAVYNIKFLEVSRQIGTKFVNIIRYNPNVGKVPIFYHLILKKKYNDYDFYKDKKTEVKGSENIAKKNAEINAELKQKKNFLFEDIFYMTEVGEVSLIKDKAYLENYDLVDIPGLSEYLPSKVSNSSDNPNTSDTLKKVQNYLDLKKRESEEKGFSKNNKSKEINYSTGIFTLIKNKINNGIIIFDATNLGREENFEIIRKFHSIIKKPIENFLILLNKIDERKNIEADIKTLETNIERFDPAAKYFYYTRNILLPCSTFSLRNEVNMEKSFKYLMYYYFYNYKLKIKKEDETFLDYLINILICLNDESNNYDKSEVIEVIEKFLNFKNLNEIIEIIKKTIIKIKSICQRYNALKIGLINEDKFNENEIKSFLKKIKEDIDDSDSDEDDISSKKKRKTDNIIIRDLSPEIILIFFYHFYTEKIKMPPISIENKKIIDYFTMENMKKMQGRGENHILYNRTIKSLEKTLQDLKIFYEGYKKKYILNKKDKQRKNLYTHQIIEKNINLISQKLEKLKYLYLPFVGLNNAGKSEIINDLIGYDLLPIGQEATTKKGILIKYWDRDEPEINKVKFKYDSEQGFFTREAFLGKGVENVKKILININEYFSNEKENFFYEVYTKMKFLEENRFSQKLKDKICFIDLPGYVTKYKFEEKEIHSQIIKCSELVIFVFEILKKGNNRENLENIIDELKTIFKTNGSQTNAALQHRILFINNIFDSDDIGEDFLKNNKEFEKEINQLKIKAKNEIMDIFGKTFNAPKVCVLNAQNYFYYNQNLNKFQQIDDYLRYEQMKYNRLIANFYKSEKSSKGIPKNFIKYLTKILKDEVEKAKTTSLLSEEKLENYNENKSPKELKKIKEISKKYFGIEENSKKFEKISSIISTINKIQNLYKFSIYLNNSYYGRFSKDFIDFILFGEKIKNKNLIDDFNFLSIQLNSIFFQQIEGEIPKVVMKPTKEPQIRNIMFNFEYDIDELVHNMFDDLKKEENNILISLNKILENLKESLMNEKHNYINREKSEGENKSFLERMGDMVKHAFNEINWTTTNEYIVIRDKIKTIFENEVNNFIKAFKEGSNNYSNIVDEYYKEIMNLFYQNLDFFDGHFPGDYVIKLENKYNDNKYQEFQTYVKKKIDNYNDKSLENVLQDIKNEILEGAEECTDYKNSKTFFDWLKKKILNSEYLFTIIDYIYEKSRKKFTEIIGNVENYFNDYPNILTINIESLISETERYFKILIDEEKKLIMKENERNKKIYEEELRKYEQEKKEWKEICEDYQKIGNNLRIYIDEIKDYLLEDVEKISSLNTENNNENIIEHEYNSGDEYKIQIIKRDNKNNKISSSISNNQNYIVENKNYKTTDGSETSIHNIQFQNNQSKIENISCQIEKNKKDDANNYSKNVKITYYRKTNNLQFKNPKMNYPNNYRAGIKNDIQKPNTQLENLDNSKNNDIKYINQKEVNEYNDNIDSKTRNKKLIIEPEYDYKVKDNNKRYHKYMRTDYKNRKNNA